MTDIPTSDVEIQEACPGIRTLTYKELAGLDRLPPLPFALLYETAPQYGHWVGVLATPEGIEHFDSYGLSPDSELKWVPKRYRQAFASGSTHLIRLLLADGRPVNYNTARLQGRGKIATCGRWVVSRCRNSGLRADEFANGMRDLARAYGITPDQLTLRMVPPKVD